MFGINLGELTIIALIALLVIGPERLPQYASQLGRFVREMRRMALGMREQVREELGPESDDIDWRKLDPRQYDPRRIVRDALTDVWDEDDDDARPARGGSAGGSAGGASGRGVSLGKEASRRDTGEQATPYDEDAT